MSEETAEIYNRAARSGISSVEAWRDLDDLALEVHWDVERMLSNERVDRDTTSEHELPR